jgi:hypothetical protein
MIFKILTFITLTFLVLHAIGLEENEGFDRQNSKYIYATI